LGTKAVKSEELDLLSENFLLGPRLGETVLRSRSS
jgi:hypothetical protein